MAVSLSRVLSAGTAAYGVYALVKPRHLGEAMTSDRREQQRYDLLATTYGCRDLTTSVVALLARSPQALRTAMVLRVVFDLGDAATLAPLAQDNQARTKVLAATLGWATLNTLAVVVDRRRHVRRR